MKNALLLLPLLSLSGCLFTSTTLNQDLFYSSTSAGIKNGFTFAEDDNGKLTFSQDNGKWEIRKIIPTDIPQKYSRYSRSICFVNFKDGVEIEYFTLKFSEILSSEEQQKWLSDAKKGDESIYSKPGAKRYNPIGENTQHIFKPNYLFSLEDDTGMFYRMEFFSENYFIMIKFNSSTKGKEAEKAFFDFIKTIRKVEEENKSIFKEMQRIKYNDIKS